MLHQCEDLDLDARGLTDILVTVEGYRTTIKKLEVLLEDAESEVEEYASEVEDQAAKDYIASQARPVTRAMDEFLMTMDLELGYVWRREFVEGCPRVLKAIEELEVAVEGLG